MSENSYASAKRAPRLLVIVNVFNPDRGGGGAIFSDLCYGLAARGYDVTVRCAYPYYPEWRDKSGRNGARVWRYDEKDAHIERYGIYIPRNPRSLLQRLAYEASFLVSLLRSLPRGRQFDLVMTYCPLVGAVAFATLNKWLYRKPLWLNVQDLSADAAAASGIARGRWVKSTLGWIQKTLFNRADVWSSISPVMVQRLETLRARHQPVLYLPNWLNKSMADEIGKLPGKVGRALGAQAKLLYAGNIGGKQDLLRFCQRLHESDAPFRFKIFGNGAEASTLEHWIKAASDARFQFGPFLEENRFAQELHDTDLFVITEKSGSGGSFIPCKMIAGIASGSPILAICDAESRWALKCAQMKWAFGFRGMTSSGFPRAWRKSTCSRGYSRNGKTRPLTARDFTAVTRSSPSSMTQYDRLYRPDLECAGNDGALAEVCGANLNNPAKAPYRSPRTGQTAHSKIAKFLSLKICLKRTKYG